LQEIVGSFREPRKVRIMYFSPLNAQETLWKKRTM